MPSEPSSTSTAPSTRPSLVYSKPLDGIRAIAVLAVLLLHYSWVSFGWIGVQLFFVLSGYLITAILVGDRDLPAGLYFKRFYWRRSLRVFPMYFGYVAVLALIYFFTTVPPGLNNRLPYLLTYTQNFWFLVTDGSPGAYTFHLWSMSVEEQFYLLWPVIVLLLSARAFRSLVAVLIAIGPLVRFVSVWLVDTYTGVPEPAVAATAFTSSQFDAFATGAAVFVFGPRFTRGGVILFAAATLALLALGQIQALMSTGSLVLDTTFGYHELMARDFQYVWGYSAINLWSALLILVALRSNPLSRALSWAPLVYLGRISYGMYVLHLATLQLVFWWLGDRHGVENGVRFLVYVGVLIAAAGASYRWFESPFLRMKDRHFVRRSVASTSPAE